MVSFFGGKAGHNKRLEFFVLPPLPVGLRTPAGYTCRVFFRAWRMYHRTTHFKQWSAFQRPYQCEKTPQVYGIITEARILTEMYTKGAYSSVCRWCKCLNNQRAS